MVVGQQSELFCLDLDPDLEMKFTAQVGKLVQQLQTQHGIDLAECGQEQAEEIDAAMVWTRFLYAHAGFMLGWASRENPGWLVFKDAE